MANYKVVDAQKLDGGLTLVADAIRKRAGTSGKMAFPEGMAETVRSIPAEGMLLPQLTNPGGASDLAYDKQLIDASGNVVTGELGEATEGVKVMAPFNEMIGTPGDTVFNITAKYLPNHIGDNTAGVILRPGALLTPRNIPANLFGDAAAADVAKGKTFTSEAGLLVEGTHECDAGMELAPLDNPATAADLVSGKSLYDQNGNLVTGTLYEALAGKVIAAQEFQSVGENGSSGLFVLAKQTVGDVVARNGTLFRSYAPTSAFGNAEASDVAKGKTFTSAAGLLVEGTMEFFNAEGVSF